MVFLFHSFETDYLQIKTSTVYHFVKVTLFGNGNIGVNFFFVLSGFLITHLLIKEKELNGKINIPKFWFRRALRIWPLYYFCVAFGFIIFPWLKTMFGQVPNENASPFYYLTFLNNFDFIKKGVPDASILGVLWSIAIEEQFYFIWPILLTIIPMRYYPYFFSCLIMGSLIFRANYDTPMAHEHHTFSCIGDMTIGAFGAFLMQKEKWKSRIAELSKPCIFTIYLLFIMVFFFRKDILCYNHYTRIFERSFIAVIGLLIILEQTFSKNSIFKMSNFKIISNLGTISYGLYCLHFFGILITLILTSKLKLNTSLWEVLILKTFCSFVITVILSKLSYKYFEGIFLQVKNKYSYFSK